MSLVSVIIPVYNAENFLNKCIDSLINSRIDELDFELILINDGSTDRSLEICKNYENQFDFVKVFDQKNQGPSAARNLGLDNAKGEWIAFVDSDDWVDVGFFKNIYKSLDKDVDLIIGGFKKIDQNNSLIEYKKWDEKDISIKKDYFEIFQDYKLFNYGYPWAKVFKKKLLIENHILFNDKIKMFEDSIFLMQYLHYVKSIRFSNSTDYIYCYIPHSLSNNLQNFNSEYTAFESLFDIATKMYRFSIEHLLHKYTELGYRISVFHNRSIISLYKFENKDQLNYLRKYPKESWVLYEHFYKPKGIKLFLKKVLLKNLLVGHFFYKTIYLFLKTFK